MRRRAERLRQQWNLIGLNARQCLPLPRVVVCGRSGHIATRDTVIVTHMNCVSVRSKLAPTIRPGRHQRAPLKKTGGGIKMKKTLLGIVAISTVLVAGSASAETKDKKIALSNNYAGNSWRQAMLKSWDKVTKPAVSSGIVAAADAYTTSENQVTEQAAQIQNLILQGYNAIVIDAASPDALNGVVKQACDAGIVVVSFDGIVNEPCAWRVAVDFKKMGRIEVDYLAKRLPAGGNLLEIRGLAGVFVDDAIHSGIDDGVKANPQFKIAGSVHGNWAQDVAQKEVAGILPSLPEIKAVVTQGGDGYGAAQAFAAAGRPTPLIIMGNRQDELQWWKEQKDRSGYETMSVSIAPGVSTLAFWVAQMILDGKKVPKDLTVPFLQINQADLEKSLATTEKGGVANVEYSAEDAAKVVAAAGK
jgi:ribose transport system substrate-binding protein